MDTESVHFRGDHFHLKCYKMRLNALPKIRRDFYSIAQWVNRSKNGISD
jgi:hypothetical protein